MITYPIILLFSILFIMFVIISFINAISPMIWYQKLNMIAYKYEYIIEKYGYLTSQEKQNLLNDMKNEGFIIENVELNIPTVKKDYGEVIQFYIKYRCPKKSVIYSNNVFNKKIEYIDLVVNKVSYSKN